MTGSERGELTRLPYLRAHFPACCRLWLAIIPSALRIEHLARLQAPGTGDPRWAPAQLTFGPSSGATARTSTRGGLTRQGIGRMVPDGPESPNAGGGVARVRATPRSRCPGLEPVTSATRPSMPKSRVTPRHAAFRAGCTSPGAPAPQPPSPGRARSRCAAPGSCPRRSA